MIFNIRRVIDNTIICYRNFQWLMNLIIILLHQFHPIPKYTHDNGVNKLKVKIIFSKCFIPG